MDRVCRMVKSRLGQLPRLPLNSTVGTLWWICISALISALISPTRLQSRWRIESDGGAFRSRIGGLPVLPPCNGLDVIHVHFSTFGMANSLDVSSISIDMGDVLSSCRLLRTCQTWPLVDSVWSLSGTKGVGLRSDFTLGAIWTTLGSTRNCIVVLVSLVASYWGADRYEHWRAGSNLDRIKFPTFCNTLSILTQPGYEQPDWRSKLRQELYQHHHRRNDLSR